MIDIENNHEKNINNRHNNNNYHHQHDHDHNEDEHDDDSFFSRLATPCCGHLPGPIKKGLTPIIQQSPFIETGYRTSMNIRHCFLSLFALHNETINVWTHLIGGLICCTLAMYSYDELNITSESTWDEELIIIIYILSAICCLFSSAIFHLFSCHPSKQVYDMLFRLDLAGIAILIGGSYVAGIYLGFNCYNNLKLFYLSIAFIITILGLYAAGWTDLHNPKDQKIRAILFASLVSFGLIPGTHWLYLAPDAIRGGMITSFLLMLLSYGLGFFIWKYKWPECFYPGKFDIYFHSHQLWHLCVLSAIFSWYYGLITHRTILEQYTCDTLLKL